MLGAVARLGEIAVSAVLHGIGVAVAKLALQGVVTALAAFVWFLGALPTVGIVEQMIAGAFWHVSPFRGTSSKELNVGYAESP